MPPVPSKDGTALMYAVKQPASGDEEATATFVERVRAATDDVPAGLSTEVTGSDRGRRRRQALCSKASTPR